MAKPRAFTFADALLALVVVVAALLLWLLPSERTGDTVVIAVDSALYGQYNLSIDTVIAIDTERGHNTVTIADGRVWVSDADCPDKQCTHQRALTQTDGGSLICLPHRLVVTLGHGAVDAVSS